MHHIKINELAKSIADKIIKEKEIYKANIVKLANNSRYFITTFRWLLLIPIIYFIINAATIFFKSTSIPVNLFKFKSDFTIAIVLIIILTVIEIMEERIQLYNKMKNFAKPIQWFLLILILLSIFVLGKWEAIDFLYFQF